MLWMLYFPMLRCKLYPLWGGVHCSATVNGSPGTALHLPVVLAVGAVVRPDTSFETLRYTKREGRS